MASRDWPSWLPSALLLLWLPGGCCLRGPGVVTGSVGGNLHVQCQYEARFKENAKYWCRSPCWDPLGTIVKTSESGRPARSGRTSIRDDPANLTFTVTLEGLTEADAGTYCCGIDKPFTFTESWIDPRVQVTVSVSPAAAPTSTLPITVTETTISTTTTEMTTRTSTGQATHSTSQNGQPNLRTHVLLSLLALLLLMLLGAALLAWKMIPRQVKAYKKSRPPQDPVQSEVCYANLELQTQPLQRELRHPPQGEVEYCTVGPKEEEVEYSTVAAPREDLHYTTVVFDDQNHNSTARGMGSRQPTAQEPEYSVVKRT